MDNQALTDVDKLEAACKGTIMYLDCLGYFDHLTPEQQDAIVKDFDTAEACAHSLFTAVLVTSLVGYGKLMERKFSQQEDTNDQPGATPAAAAHDAGALQPADA